MLTDISVSAFVMPEDVKMAHTLRPDADLVCTIPSRRLTAAPDQVSHNLILYCTKKSAVA